jgi:hypothetical protein
MTQDFIFCNCSLLWRKPEPVTDLVFVLPNLAHFELKVAFICSSAGITCQIYMKRVVCAHRSKSKCSLTISCLLLNFELNI